jgi:phage terminase Nu1 subunit (DNA packaging protein)
MPRRSKVGGKRPGAGRKPAPGESFEAARRRKEIALADLRQIEVRVKRGELLEAEAVSREWCDMMRRIQAGILAVSSRLRQQLLHLTARDVQVIDRELRDALAGLAGGQGEAGDRGGDSVSAA